MNSIGATCRPGPAAALDHASSNVFARSAVILAQHPRAQAIQIPLAHTDVAEALDLAEPNRVGRDVRVLVRIQSDKEGAIVHGADLRVETEMSVVLARSCGSGITLPDSP